MMKQLKEELKDMKTKACDFQNSDYRIGYISAISTIEGVIASLEYGEDTEQSTVCDTLWKRQMMRNFLGRNSSF